MAWSGWAGIRSSPSICWTRASMWPGVGSSAILWRNPCTGIPAHSHQRTAQSSTRRFGAWNTATASCIGMWSCQRASLTPNRCMQLATIVDVGRREVYSDDSEIPNLDSDVDVPSIEELLRKCQHYQNLNAEQRRKQVSGRHCWIHLTSDRLPRRIFSGLRSL